MVVQRFDQDRGLQIASSLTYTTLLSIVPVITIALTLISAFPAFGYVTSALQSFIVQNLLPQSIEALSSYSQQFTSNATKLTAVGIGFLVVTSVLLMLTIERAFNQIWRARRPRPLLHRIFIYWTFITIGPVLIGASLTLTSWFVSQSLGFVEGIPGAAGIVLKAVPFVLTSLAFALLYVALPARRIARGDALIGGVLAGLAFELMKRGFGFYIEQFPTYRLVYGAFAALPIFLIWVYLSWAVILFGAVVVAVLPEWRVNASQRSAVPGSDFFDALQMLKVLWRAHEQGLVVTTEQLTGAVSVRLARLESILETMVGAAWIARVAPAGWALTRDLDAITVADVYRLFIFNAAARIPTRDADPELETLVHELGVKVTDMMAMPVDEFFRTAEQNAGPGSTPSVV